MARSGVDRSWADSSTSTRRRPETAGQAPWPRSGTRQACGHKIRALVRSPDKLTVTDPGLEVMTGQATDAQDVGAAMAGVDAVISTLGGRGGNVLTRATRGSSPARTPAASGAW
jgi:uncharacterized protein YbjT (DUF2867 family)